MDTIIIEDMAMRLIFSSRRLFYKLNTITNSNYHSIFRLIKKPLIVPDKLDKSSSTG